jgi:mono/diheme cytochrome c family protein
MPAVGRLERPFAILLGGAVLAVAAAGCGVTNDEPDLVAGKKAFAEKCGSCHVLARAGTKGIQGPNLDEAFRQGLADGMERSGVEGVVHAQIDNPAMVPKDSGAYMPPDIVTGRQAENVAAYVADAVAKPGDDEGLLAEAVPKAGSGKPAVAENGEVEIPATAQLAYETDKAEAEAGQLTIKSPNPSGTPHDIALEGNGVNEKGETVSDGGVSEIQVDLQAGEYTFYCSVDGHRQAGMEGKLTVK